MKISVLKVTELEKSIGYYISGPKLLEYTCLNSFYGDAKNLYIIVFFMQLFSFVYLVIVLYEFHLLLSFIWTSSNLLAHSVPAYNVLDSFMITNDWIGYLGAFYFLIYIFEKIFNPIFLIFVTWNISDNLNPQTYVISRTITWIICVLRIIYINVFGYWFLADCANIAFCKTLNPPYNPSAVNSNFFILFGISLSLVLLQLLLIVLISLMRIDSIVYEKDLRSRGMLPSGKEIIEEIKSLSSDDE